MTSLMLKIAYQLYVKTPFGPWYFKRELKKAVDQFENSFHSKDEALVYGFIIVKMIPYGITNYGFIIWAEKNGNCIVVDPGYSTPFETYLSLNNLTPTLILVTHKHHDHSYGVKDLKILYPNTQVVCSALDQIDSATRLLYSNHTSLNLTFKSNNEYSESQILTINAFLVPGHTTGSVIYSISMGNEENIHGSGDSDYALYFTGDTVFTGSIGKMFECNASTYFQSIRRFLQSLLENSCPLENIYIFPAHEYGLTNLQFVSEKLDPTNINALNKWDWCKSKRESKDPTVPSNIIEEISYNPFLRIVLSDDKLLLRALSNKFEKTLDIPNIGDLMESFVFSQAIKHKLCSVSPVPLPVRIFKEVRKLRDY